MHPARAKAKQTAAIVETAASVASLKDQMDRIEAGQAEILARLDAASTPADPPKAAKK